MLTWIMENMATMIISTVLIIIAAAVIAGMARGKRRGKSSCQCGCAGCPAGGCRAVNNALPSGKPQCF